MIFFQDLSGRKFVILLIFEYILIVFLIVLNLYVYRSWFCSTFSVGCPTKEKVLSTLGEKPKDNIFTLHGVIKNIEEKAIILVPEDQKNEVKIILTQDTKFIIRPLYIFPEKGDNIISTNSSALKIGQKVELFAKLEEKAIKAYLIAIFH